MLRISEVHSQPNQTSRITAQKIKFSIKDFFSKCEKIFSFLRIWSHLLQKSLMEHFIFFCSGCCYLQIWLKASNYIRKSSILVAGLAETATGDVLYQKDILKSFAKFAGKNLCQSLFFNKVAGLRPAALLKKRPWQSCFLVNYEKFLKTLFY